MSHAQVYKSISVAQPLPATGLSKIALASSNVSSLCLNPRTHSRSITWSGFKRSRLPIPRRMRAPRCSASVGNGLDSRSLQARPSPAEASRTVMEMCSEGTLCTLTQDGWPFGTAVKFAVDVQGMPVFCLDPSAAHAPHVLLDKRCSLHVQLDQMGCRKAQCTLMGTISKPEDKMLKQGLQAIWERRFVEKVNEDHLYVVTVKQVLQSQDLGEEAFWVEALAYSRALADPLRDHAAKIVKDMNDQHWEDIHRFCNVYTDLGVEKYQHDQEIVHHRSNPMKMSQRSFVDLQVEAASMIWIDRLGFDLRLLTRPHRETLEVRIPFPREVTDEKDARSSLTYMSQVAWEVEKNYAPPEFERIKCIQKSRR